MAILADQSTPTTQLRERLKTLEALEAEARAEAIRAHERWVTANNAERIASAQSIAAGEHAEGIRRAVNALRSMLPDDGDVREVAA